MSKFFNGKFRVKAGRGWVNVCLQILIIIRGRLSSPLVRGTVHIVGRFHHLYKTQGNVGLVIYTKATYVLLQQVAAGMKTPSTQALGPGVSRSRDGMPRIIPSIHRQRIRNGDSILLRYYLSLFSIYRVLDFKGYVKLGTITAPGVAISPSFMKEWEQACKSMVGWSGVSIPKFVKEMGEIKYVQLNKSAPALTGTRGSKLSTSTLGITLSAAALAKNPRVLDALVKWASGLWPQGNRKGAAFAGISYTNNSTRNYFVSDLNEVIENVPSRLNTNSLIGKLGFKPEAAGKVRVFAMVDCWTQWALRPLHLGLFWFLSILETDGTEDQLAPVHRLLGKGHRRFWCYDLSAATDRLPISIQVVLLSQFVGKEMAELWKVILVERDYVLPKLDSTSYKWKEQLPKLVRYSVGQPMGALSSWAMLALTHHVIVMMAAKRAGYQYGLFWDYAILGDDIVIANGRVAREYLSLLRTLGVEVGLAKSLVSRIGRLEFAKKYLSKDVDMSPIPFKEVWTGLRNGSAFMELVRKYEISFTAIASLLGYGFRVKARLGSEFEKFSPPKRLLSLSRWYFSPLGMMPMDLNSWFMIKALVPLFIAPTGQMYVDLPKPAKLYLEAKSIKLIEKIDKFRQLIRGFTGTYEENPTIWVEYALYEWTSALFSESTNPLEKTTFLKVSGALMNPLYNIYREFINVKLQLLRRDYSQLERLARKMARKDLYGEDLIQYWSLASVIGSVGLLKDPNRKSSKRTTPNGYRLAETWFEVDKIRITESVKDDVLDTSGQGNLRKVQKFEKWSDFRF